MKVFLTRRAERNYKAIREYIAHEFGEQTAETFTRKADETFQLHEEFPNMGPVASRDIRDFQLSRQTLILYRVKQQKIIILSLFDVRQNPRKRIR